MYTFTKQLTVSFSGLTFLVTVMPWYLFSAVLYLYFLEVATSEKKNKDVLSKLVALLY